VGREIVDHTHIADPVREGPLAPGSHLVNVAQLAARQSKAHVSQRGVEPFDVADRGVETGVYYPTPLHRLPSFAVRLELPETERACREVLSLPVHPGLSAGDVMTVVDLMTRSVRPV